MSNLTVPIKSMVVFKKVLPGVSDVKSWSWSWSRVSRLVVLVLICLGFVSFGLGLELCGLVNNVARPADS